MRAGKKIRRKDCGMYEKMETLCVHTLQDGNSARTTGTRGGEEEVIYYYKIDVENMFYQQISIFEHGTFPRLQDQIV
jgi:hypothetical protein